MSSVKANWHLDALDLTDDDPMRGDIADFAKPIDLSKSVPEIREELRHLANKEARYFNTGLTCDLKWTVAGPDGTPEARNPCYVCPHYTEDYEAPDTKALLCKLGRQQNDTLDALAALSVRATGMDVELVAIHERASAEAEELLQAVA